MKIEIGKLYENKTWKYLVPCLNGHGQEFITRFNQVFKLAVGIGDMLLEGSPIADKKALYVLIDKLYQAKIVELFVTWLKYQPYYIADYCPDTDLENSRKHMLVIAVPKMFHDTYDHFIKGTYSMMYKHQHVANMNFLSEERKAVLTGTQSKEAIAKYKTMCKEEFGIVPTAEVKELDLPPKKVEEIFNYTDKQKYF